MPRFIFAYAFAGALLVAPVLAAQSPNDRPFGPPPSGAAGPMRGGMPGRDVASLLLSHTGELKLSDQQVTRLAAIARRSADRREAMRRGLDSLIGVRAAPSTDSSARGRRTPSPQFRAAAERMHEQMHADLREALSVLTPDQQATAWEIAAMRGGGERGGRLGRAGPMGMHGTR